MVEVNDVVPLARQVVQDEAFGLMKCILWFNHRTGKHSEQGRRLPSPGYRVDNQIRRDGLHLQPDGLNNAESAFQLPTISQTYGVGDMCLLCCIWHHFVQVIHHDVKGSVEAQFTSCVWGSLNICCRFRRRRVV